jgi:PhnB protein
MGICDRRSLTMSARWLPKGFHTITPNIIVDDAEQAVAFFKNAFGASESYRLTMSNGKIAHCELKLGDSDALFDRAVQAGARVIMPMTDMFFGSRDGRVADPFGNVWTIATLKEEVAPAEIQRRMKAEGY